MRHCFLSTILALSLVGVIQCFDTRRFLDDHIRRTSNFADFVSVPLWARSHNPCLLFVNCNDNFNGEDFRENKDDVMSELLLRNTTE